MTLPLILNNKIYPPIVFENKLGPILTLIIKCNEPTFRILSVNNLPYY